MIGLIVDGPGDYASFDERFKGRIKVLKADGPRGHAASPADIVASARKQVIMLMCLGCSKVAIITDYEKRTGGCQAFLAALRNEVNDAKFNIPVHIAVPNQMIENWYLADIVNLSKKKVYIRDNLTQKRYEGTDGKRMLRTLFKPKYAYHEIKHGAELFKLIRINVARANSESFDLFMKSIGLA